MARYEPPGGRLINTYETNEGSSFGKPNTARYNRMFVLPPGDREQQLQHAVDAAVAVGWTLNGDTHPHRGPFGLIESAEKRLPGGRSRLALTLFPNGPPSMTDQPAIFITLEHQGH